MTSRRNPRSVALMSPDNELAKLCREVLEEIFGGECALVIGSHRSDISNCDVCIWDLSQGGGPMPHDVGRAKLSTHFFLAHENSLAEFQPVAGSSDLNILVKPVTRASLRAFLSGPSESGTSRGEALPGSLDNIRAERDQILHFLIHANLKLQQYDQERTNFLARSLCEFRSPLTAVAGYCALALEEELGPLTAELRDVLQKMQRSAARMSRIAKAMFQLSTRQPGDLTPIPAPADIRQCVEQALFEVAALIESKQIVTSVEIALQPQGLLFEREELEQALINLLENACKFTPRSGNIDIKGYPFFWNRRTGCGAPIEPALDRRVAQADDPNAFRVDIRDSGPGIPPSHLERIFEEYTSYSGTDDRSGGGLGLAICRMILQRHQGRIWAESAPHGAIFSFVLPVRQNGSRGVARTDVWKSKRPIGKED